MSFGGGPAPVRRTRRTRPASVATPPTSGTTPRWFTTSVDEGGATSTSGRRRRSAGNVLQGLTSIAGDEVPAARAGSRRGWCAPAAGRCGPPIQRVRVESAPVNGVEEWFARFELLVPPSGPSEERTIGVSTDGRHRSASTSR